MAKNDYFEMLEALAENALEAVKIVCSPNFEIIEKEREKRIFELKSKCEMAVCEIELKLFSDFIPPLQRDNIALYAHSLSRVVDRAYDLLLDCLSKNGGQGKGSLKGNKSCEVCLKLAEKLLSSTKLLRTFRSPSCKVNMTDFRKMLCEGREASSRELEKVRRGVLPSSCADRIYGADRLRYELSSCFDSLIEVMLNNI